MNRHYFDKHGGLHHRNDISDPSAPNFTDPLTSENAPMFTGIYIVLLYEKRKLTIANCSKFLRYVIALSPLNPKNKGKWRTTPASKSDRFSRDNWQGIFAGILMCEKIAKKKKSDKLLQTCKKIRKTIPIFHKQYLHPRTFLLALSFKFRIPFLLMTIPMLDAIWTCYTTYKVRNNKYIYKTDGKLLSYMTTKAFSMKLTYHICNFVVFRKRSYRKGSAAPGRHFAKHWTWDNWKTIAKHYFLNNKDHPIVKLMENV